MSEIFSLRGASRSRETARNPRRNDPLPSFPETMHDDGVTAPPHLKNAASARRDLPVHEDAREVELDLEAHVDLRVGIVSTSR